MYADMRIKRDRQSWEDNGSADVVLGIEHQDGNAGRLHRGGTVGRRDNDRILYGAILPFSASSVIVVIVVGAADSLMCASERVTQKRWRAEVSTAAAAEKRDKHRMRVSALSRPSRWRMTAHTYDAAAVVVRSRNGGAVGRKTRRRRWTVVIVSRARRKSVR